MTNNNMDNYLYFRDPFVPVNLYFRTIGTRTRSHREHNILDTITCFEHTQILTQLV